MFPELLLQKVQIRYLIGHPHDHRPIMLQIGMQRTNRDQEFCYRYDYAFNIIPFWHV